MDLVELSTLTTVFERHGYGNREKTTLGATALWRLLLELFKQTPERTSAGVTARMNVETVAELVMNWVLNLFDASVPLNIINVLGDIVTPWCYRCLVLGFWLVHI